MIGSLKTDINGLVKKTDCMVRLPEVQSRFLNEKI